MAADDRLPIAFVRKTIDDAGDAQNALGPALSNIDDLNEDDAYYLTYLGPREDEGQDEATPRHKKSTLMFR